MKENLQKIKDIVTPEGIKLGELYDNGSTKLVVTKRRGRYSIFPSSYLIRELTGTNQHQKE